MYCESEVCRFSKGFEDNCSRLCFIRRVFCLLILGLTLMIAQVLIVTVDSGLADLLKEFYWIAFLALTVFISACMLLSCSNLARSCFPWNFILFLFLVESLSVVLAVMAAFLGGTVIVLSVACFACVLLMLLIMSMTVPVDFTKWTAFFLVIFLIIFVFALATIVTVPFLNVAVMDVAISLTVVTVLSLMMLLNIQILFNDSIFELCPDDFILGAILMFANIVILFMCCLKLVGFDTDEC